MAFEISKYTVWIIVVIVIGFFITWDLNKRQTEKVLQSGGETGDVEMVPDNVREVVIPVTGMSCQSCEILIERSMNELDGIHRVKANHVDGEVVADYDPGKVSLTEMKEAITRAGYTPEDPVAE